MKDHLFLSDDDQNGIPKSSFFWWRTTQDFDENGHLKMAISEVLSNLTPRFRVLREMERLGFIAVEGGLDDLRHKLMGYRAGDFWLPIGGIKKEETDIPDVNTIVLIGLSGSGKSSFVNLLYSVLGRSGLIPFAQTSVGKSANYTTMFLEEHHVLRSPRSGFCVYDTRGLDKNQMEEGLNEIMTWMSEGVQHNQLCYRIGDDKVLGTFNGSKRLSKRYVKRKVNCVMVVADLSEVHRAFNGGDMKSIEALRDIFHSSAIENSNENPILILTHGDTLNAEERINGRLKVCEYLGISETTGAYDIPCLTEQGILTEEADPVTAFALTEAVYRALMQSDRTHLPKMKFEDWMILFFAWIMCFLASFSAVLASFFAVLADFFSEFGHRIPCEYLGISETTGSYNIPCLTKQGILTKEANPVTAFALTEAVYRALMQSDGTHLPKRKFKDWMILFFAWIMWFLASFSAVLASFFAVLADFFSKFGHDEKQLKL